MKTIGLIGGMSWESSREYYRIINETVREKLGDPHSCKTILYSVDFAEIETLQHRGEWQTLTDRMIAIAKTLEHAGAELLVICTNTMHAMADDIQKNINVPIVHIVDTVAEEIIKRNLHTVGLLGTRFTMEHDFYKGRLKEIYGIDVLIPEKPERDIVHTIIYKELIAGIVNEDSREKFKAIMGKLHEVGAGGVILGCTEIPLLIKEEDCVLPVFDTTMLHARKAVELALESGPAI